MMEGDDAKGVVAVLQRLNDREVVIALANGQRDQEGRGQTKPRAAVKPLLPLKSSVHTNTERVRDSTTNRHVQICDDRYASCYQVAHCSVSPTSPPVPVSEFPPQRANPAYNEGNFEVGGQGSWQSEGPCRASHFRGGLTWPDRGSVYCNKSSRDADAFAESLRKYPSESPERSPSSELVERLLKYTQAKYAQKAAKSMRSISTEKSPDRRGVRSQSRHMQTAFRSQDTIRRSGSPSRRLDSFKRRAISPSAKRDCGTDRVEVEQEERSRNRRSRSRTRNVDDSILDSTYNYLKAGAARSRDRQPSEQLYMDDFSRQVRSVIKQFCKPSPVVFQVCPRIQKRYLAHKKICPVRNSATWMSDEDDMSNEASSSSRAGRFFQSIGVACEAPSKTHLTSKHSQQQTYCHCTQTIKCQCKPTTNNKPDEESIQSNASQYNEYKCQSSNVCCKDPCECKPHTNKGYYNKRIEDEVARWLKTIPLDNNESPEDKKRRKDIGKQLAVTLNSLPDDENFDDNARNAIEKCVEEMPMWHPGTKKDEELIKKQLTQHLLDKVTNIPRKPDKLRDAVKNFINSINFNADVDRDVIIDNFVNKLKFYAISAPKDDAVFKELLINEVTEMLAELPIQYRGDKNVILKTLARKLADEVELLFKDKDITDERADDSLKPKFREVISKWFNEVADVNDKLPSSDELNKIINNLALMLDNIQSQGIDDITIHKMEMKIGNVLEELDTPVKLIDDLTDSLVDNITDVIYARDKNKLESQYKQFKFKELNTWLQNLKGIENLSSAEQYKLTKEIVDRVPDSNAEKNEAYQDYILKKISDFKGRVDPLTLNSEMGEIIDRLQLLPDKLKKDDLITNIQNDFNDIIDKSNIPESEKRHLKDKSKDIVMGNIQASPLATQRDLDDMREMLLEQMYDTIEHLPITVQNDLKNKVDNVLDKHINKIQSENDKDTVRYTLLKELNYIIDKEPIPDDDKNDIKYNIKNTINDNFDQPFSYHVQDHIKANISGIVASADMEKDKKEDLINKLTNVVDKKVAKLPKQSMKEYVKNKIFQDMSKAMNKSEISEDAKDTIKQKLKYMLNHNFDQPFSADIKEAIFNDINHIIDNSTIPRSVKNDLKQKLIHDADKNLVDLPDQTTIDHTKECIMKDVNEFLEDISLPKEHLHDLKKVLERTFAEFLDRPYTRDRRDKLNETLTNIITDLDIPSDLKHTVTKKLINITDKKLDQLAYQTPEEYARDTIVRDIKQVLNELSLATNEKEKQELEKRFEDLVEESLRSGYLDEGRDVIKQGLVDIIRDSSAPQHKQDDFIFKSLHAVSKILDESYYEDYDREQLKDFYDMIDSAKMQTAKKNILKPKTKKIVDDHTLDPDYGNIKEIIKQAIDFVDEPSQMSISGLEPDVNVDDEVIDEISKAIRTSPLSNKKKALLEDNLDILVGKLLKNEDVDATIKDLENIIEEIPQPSHDKKVLKSKLAMMANKDSEEVNKQLKENLIKDLECAVDSISLGKEKETELKSKMKDLVLTLDEPVLGNVKQKLKDEAFNIVDKAVYSKDKKSQLRDRITNIIDKLPSQKQDKSAINDKLLSRVGDIVDETPIRSHIKEDIKSQIRDIISENAKHPSKNKTKDKMKTDIANIINAAPITEYQKRALKHKITKVLDPLPGTSGEKNLILDNIFKILDDESLSKAKKSELKKKIQQNLSDVDESTTNYVKNKKIKDVLKAIDDTVMSKDKKASIKAKLEHELTKNIETLPSSSKPKQKLLGSLEDIISNEIDNAFIPQSTKLYLKKRIKGTLPQLLQQPMSTNLEESINKELTNILEEVALSKAEKDILKNNLANTVSEKIGEPRSNTEIAEMRNNLIHNVNSILDEIQMSKDDKKELQFQLQDLLNEFIQTPVTTNTLKAMDKEIKNIIAEAPISKEKKAEIQNKLGKIIEHNLKPLSSHDYKEYDQPSDKKVVDEIDSILDDIQINSVEKKELTRQIKECMEESFNEPLNKETILFLKDNINDIISAAPIPIDKKSGIVKKISNIIDNKTKLERHKQNGKLLESDINQSKLTSPTRKDIPETLVLSGPPKSPKRKTSVTDKLQNEIDKRLDEPFIWDEFDDRIPAIKSAVTDAIYSILDKLHLNNYDKRTLGNQLKVMLDANLEKPINSDTMRHIKNDIIDIISEHPTARDNETEIRRLVSNMINDVIPSSPAKGIIVDDRKTKGKVKIDTEDSRSERGRSRTKPPQVKNAIVNEEIDSVIGQLKIPSQLKSVLQQKLKVKAEEGIEDIGKTSGQRLKLNKKKYKPREDTKLAITDEIDAILDTIPINNTQKDDLKQQLKDMVDENIEKPINSDTLLVIKNNIDNIISEAPIPSDKKSFIRKKLNNMVDNKIGSSSDTNVHSYKHKPKTKQKEITKRELQSQGTSTSDRKYSTDETMVSKPISDIKTDVANEIDSIIDQLGVSNYQKESLKQQIIDVMDENSDKPTDKDTMRYIKNTINDIISEAPIPKEKKQKFIKNLGNIIDNKVESSKDVNHKKSHSDKNTKDKYKPISNMEPLVADDIDDIVEQLDISNHQKNTLKQQFNDAVTETLENASDSDRKRYMKNKINDIISKASVSKDKKLKLTKDLNDMIEDKIDLIADKSADYKYTPVSNVKTAVMEDIDSIVDELDINNYQKNNLKQQLNDMIDINLDKPMKKDTIKIIKNSINDIVSKAPISKEAKIETRKKLTEIVDDKLESLPEQSKFNKIYKTGLDKRPKISEEINDMVDELKINNYQSDKLKHQIKDILGDNLDKPINKDTIRSIKSKINDTVSEAPIPKDKKQKLAKDLAYIIDKKVESIPTESISYKKKPVSYFMSERPVPLKQARYIYEPNSDTKDAITEGIDSVIDQLQINDNQKNNLRHQLQEMVIENLEKPFDSNTVRQIENKINSIVSEAPISKDTKQKLIKNLGGVVKDNIESGPSQNIDYEHKPLSEIKTAVIDDIDSIVHHLDLNDYQKDNLKHELNSMVDTNLQEPINVDTIRNIQTNINDIISKAPISKDKKIKLTKELFNMVDDKVELIADKTMKDGYKPISETKSKVTDILDSTTDDLDLDDKQKEKIIQKLNDLLESNAQKPITKDNIKTVKKQINDIVSEMPIPKNKKAEVINKLNDMLDNTKQSRYSDQIGPDSEKPRKVSPRISDTKQPKFLSPNKMNNIMQDFDSVLEQIQIPNEHKKVLKRDLKERMNKHLNEPLSVDVLSNIKKDIKSIITKAPISKEEKAEIRNKMSNMVDTNFGEPQSKTASKINANKVISEIESDLDQLQISDYEKNKIRNKLKNMIRENSRQPAQVIKEGIHDIIEEANIPRNNKAEIIYKLRNRVDQDTLDIAPKTPIDRHKAKHGRDITAARERSSGDKRRDSKQGTVLLNDEALHNINDVLETLQIPSEEKNNIISRINDKVSEHSGKPMSNDTLEQIKEQINDIISEIPIDKEDQIALENKIFKELGKNREYLSDEDYPTSSYKKTKRRYENPRSSIRSKPARSQWPYPRRRVTYDAEDEDTRHATSMRIPKRKYGPNESDKGRSAIKQNLTEASEDDEEDDDDYEDIDSADELDTTDMITRNISGIIDDLAISKQKKKDLRGQLKRTLNLENSKSDLGMGHTKMLKKTESVISGLPIPDHIKEMMMTKLGIKNDSLSPESGFATSTPKKGRKNWEEPKSFSSISFDDIDSLEMNEYWENITDSINTWLDSLPVDLDEETKEAVREGIASDIRNRQEYLKSNPDAIKSISEELKNLQNQVLRRLSKVLDKEDMRIAKRAADDLMQSMNAVKIPEQILKKGKASPAVGNNGSSEISEYWDNINDSINNWLNSLPIDLDEETKQTIREGIASDIRNRQEYLKSNPNAMKSIAEELENIQHKVLRRLSKVLDKDDMKVVKEAADDLIQSMKAVKVPRRMKEMSDEDDVADWKSPAAVRNKVVHWIDTLPLEPSVKNSSKFQTLQRDLVSNLMDRLEEMNCDPEIVNDNTVYEDMLSDETDKLIGELPIDPDSITNEKEDLIKQLMACKPTTLVGKEGTVYRQQLKDTISKTLPIEDASPEDVANFELLKDGVADAFVSLHYAGGSEEQRKKLKKRMYDEVHKYCNDYLKKHPNEPVSSEKLADGLYNALKKVPLPPEESMRAEEEQIRVKDVINEWMKDLPLDETTATKRLQMNKDASKLASKLSQDIERNDSKLPDLRVNTEMQKQITKFLKTLPLKPGQEKKIDTFGKQLISKLRATKFARRVDDSTRCSISQDDTLRPIWSSYEDDGMCPFYKSLLERRKQQARRNNTCIMPTPCTLSDEDREHLERIRQRACMTPDCLSALLRGGKRNSFVNPMVTETGSQTEQNLEAVGQRISFQPCPSTDRNSPRPCPGIPSEVSRQVFPPQVTKGQFVESGSQIEIQPQIIIKEYYWDTTTSDIPPSGSRHSTSSLRRRCTVPCEQLPPCSDIRPQHSMRSQNKSFQERRAGPSLPCTSSPYMPRPCRSRPSLSHIPPCDPSPSTRVCSPRPFTPRPFTSRTCNSPMSQSFIPQQHSTPRNSFGQFYRDCEYNGPKRNGLQQEYPECSSSRYSRKERVIELGSLDDLRKPTQRNRSDNCEWCSYFPEDDFWGTPSGHETEDDPEVPCSMPYIREKKEERIRCKCKEKLMMNVARRRPRQHCQKHSNIWTNCMDNSRKNCSRCFGSHCPYPSYMYFQE